MKNTFKKLTCLMISLLAVGCSQGGASSVASKSSNPNNSKSSSQQQQTTSSNAGGRTSSNQRTSSSSINSNSGAHVHNWDTEWSYDDTTHYHVCKECGAKKDITAHKVSADWQTVNLGEYLNDTRYRHSTVKIKACSDCGYNQQQDTDVLPRLYFQSDDPSAISFAVTASSTDQGQRPEVSGKLTLNNCAEKYQFTDVVAGMKVRGNQTAGFPKKGFRIKFNKAHEMLDLNSGKAFKKWVLLADAKDSCIIRTGIGLTTSRAIAQGTKVWASDITPVSVYLNNEYWGFYYLAEQKESKTGRINLPAIADTETSVNIGYCFELDHYAEDEPKKPDGGDPTFTLDYGNKFTRSSYSIESSLANFGPTTTYTMNSDITDVKVGEGTPVNENNSGQVRFIRDRMQALFEVLYQAAIKNKAYTIGNDPANTSTYNKAVEATGKTVEQAVKDNFDLEAWAVGFIINAFCCPPDVGYSSFYMSFDNSATGEKKLRFDNPWDFDSNFGNRNNFITSADSASGGSQWGGGGMDPYYMDRTSNMWLQYLSKLDFFINDYVKPKWNQVREQLIFEKMFQMMRVYFQYYDYEARKNFTKWPEIKASDDNVGSYFGGELRDVFKDPKNRKNAQAETINWCSKRVNYLEKKWGNNRPNVDTGA